jgi:hypothetical protein
MLPPDVLTDLDQEHFLEDLEPLGKEILEDLVVVAILLLREEVAAAPVLLVVMELVMLLVMVEMELLMIG